MVNSTTTATIVIPEEVSATVSEVQNTVSSTLTDLSSVTANVTDEGLLTDLNDLGDSITDLGELISSSSLLGAAAGRLKRDTGLCSTLILVQFLSKSLNISTHHAQLDDLISS